MVSLAYPTEIIALICHSSSKTTSRSFPMIIQTPTHVLGYITVQPGKNGTSNLTILKEDQETESGLMLATRVNVLTSATAKTKWSFSPLVRRRKTKNPGNVVLPDVCRLWPPAKFVSSKPTLCF
jgi:hypothetical protein